VEVSSGGGPTDSAFVALHLARGRPGLTVRRCGAGRLGLGVYLDRCSGEGFKSSLPAGCSHQQHVRTLRRWLLLFPKTEVKKLYLQK